MQATRIPLPTKSTGKTNAALFRFLVRCISGPWPERIWVRIRSSAVGTAVCLLLFWVAVYYMSVSVNDPFMYFSF